MTLGWTNEDDFVYANSYGGVEIIKFVDGKAFHYYEESGKGVVVENADNIGGKTLYPFDGNKNSLKNAIISGVQTSYSYTGEEIALTYKVTDVEGTELVEGADYTASLNGSPVKDMFIVKDAGEYTLTITAKENGAYTGSKNVNFTVAKRSLENATVSGVQPSYSYTGDEIALTYKVTDIEGKELVEGTDYTASLNGSPVKDVFIVKDAGEYTLTITAKENGAYTGSKNVNFTVAKRSLENATVSGVQPSYSYTGDEIALTYKVTDIEGKELVEGTDYTASLNGSPVKDVFIVKEAGDYMLTIVAKENGEYAGSKSVYFTVAKRSLENATVSGVQPCYSYTGEEISLTYKVSDFEGKELVEGTDYTASLNGTLVKDVFIVKDIGDYTFTITAKDGGFYTGSKTVNISVAPPYIISSKKDWDDFAKSVNEGETYSGKYIKLNDNISVSTKVGVRNGSQDRAFSGVFDGGGHTITADITDKDNSGTALFGYISGATIKNLTLAGKITGGIHAAGIVGLSAGKGNRIDSCIVSATIDGGTHIGGILGHGLGSDIAIDNCVFKGELVGGETAKGVLFGWGEEGGSKIVSNSLYILQDNQNMDNLDLVKKDAGSVIVKNSYMAYLTAPVDDFSMEKPVWDGTKCYIVGVSISGIQPYYSYTGEEIALTYKVTDIEGKALIENTDYTASLDKYPVKDKGDYTLTITAKDGGTYTGKTTVGFTVNDVGVIPVTATTTAMTNGIYWVSSDVTIDERIVIKGDVTLFLNEGKTLTASKGIKLSKGNKLTIDGKGTLNANGESENSGIGDYEVGSLVVENGIVNVRGGDYAAGIGGSVNNREGGDITIKGGFINATGGVWASDIGGGYRSWAGAYGLCGTIKITGGKVTANGGRSFVGIGPGLSAPASGSVTLGWTNEDDFIYASSYGNVETIKFVDGKPFYYEENGKEVIVESADNIGGKKLRPIYEKNGLYVSGVNPYYSYTGEEIALTYKVTNVKGEELVEGTDYTVSFIPSPVKDVGVYTLIIIAAKEDGAYTGSKSVNFVVVKRSLENATISGIQPSYSYTGEEIALTYKVTDSDGKELVEGTDYTVSFSPSPVKNAGKYILTITAKENGAYTGSKSVGFVVFKQSLDNATVSGIQSYYLYTGNKIDLMYMVTDSDGKELVEGTDYKVSFSPSPIKDVGDYTLTIAAGKNGFYTGKKTVNFTVADRIIPVTATTTAMTNGVYVVSNDVTIDERIVVTGVVKLILEEGKTLTASEGINVSNYNKIIPSENELIIDGKGSLYAKGVYDAAGIGGDGNDWGGSITVNGGFVTATGGDNGAGIGAGNGAIYGGTITVNGGFVTAMGGYNGAGIGGGSGGHGGTITINGGVVSATGGFNGAGIGGGLKSSNSDVIIEGGIVTATGGYNGAGIGGGKEGHGGGIMIFGGKVTANGRGLAVGMGPGFDGPTRDDFIYLEGTNEDDFIYASSYGNVLIGFDFYGQGNKQLYYEENGEIIVVKDEPNIGGIIGGKTLRPILSQYSLKFAGISGIQSNYLYNGDEIELTYKVTDSEGKELVKNTDYTATVTPSPVKDVGEYTMVFTGRGNYKGTKKVKFSIVPKVILASGAIQVFEDENGKRAEIAGEYDGAEAVNITEDIKNVAVTFNREFTPNSGYATIMFPFDVNASSLTGVKSVIEFDGVKTDKNDNKTVGMRYVWCDATLGEQELEKGHPDCNKNSGELKAYTPYMIEMESPTLGIKDAVTLKSNSGKIVGDAPEGNWVFRGTLQKKEWSKEDDAIQNGQIWAFAGSERNGASIGKFVQFGGNNWVNPFRAYLIDCTKYPDPDASESKDNQPKPSLVSRYRFADALAPASSAENSLSAKTPAAVAASETASIEGMDIVIVYGDKDSIGEHTTVIGRMNPATGEIRMLPRTKQTYDLKGRRVGNGKKAKGAYYRK